MSCEVKSKNWVGIYVDLELPATGNIFGEVNGLIIQTTLLVKNFLDMIDISSNSLSPFCREFLSH